MRLHSLLCKTNPNHCYQLVVFRKEIKCVGVFAIINHMQIPTLDYRALDASPHQAVLLSTPNARRRAKIFVAYLAVLFISLIIANGAAHIVALAIFFGTIAILAGWLIVYARKLAKLQAAREAALTEFATTNKLPLAIRVADPHYNGLMFQVGHDRRLDASLTIPAQEGAIELANYRYTTGDDKHQTVNLLGFIRIKLPRRLPNMVLDARANNVGDLFSNLGPFDKRQTLQLEGDFNNYFTLYAPKEYERDALYIFTPDVMATLVDDVRNYDVEIVDDDMYLYSTRPFDLNDKQVLSQLIGLASTVDDQIRKQAAHYADEKVANSAQTNQVGAGGLRLKRHGGWILAAAFISYWALNIMHGVLSASNSQLGKVSTVLLMIGVWGFVGFVLYRQYRRANRP